jgi:[protein-PII] uridylyltransferase
MLYLLSIADAKATGPTVWSNWKGALLLDLYLKIGLLFDKVVTSDLDMAQGLAWICTKVTEILGEQQSVCVKDLPEDYLLNFSPEEIAGHIQSRGRLDKEGALVDLQNGKNHCSILMMTNDRPGLLASLCGVLALHDLKVLSAQIFTWPDGTVVDMLNVLSPYSDQHEPPDIPSFKKDLDLAINHRLGLEHRLDNKNVTSSNLPRVLPHQAVKVNFDNDSSSQYTIIEVHAQDSAGLLYVITRTLSYFKINIFRAKIGNRSDQVVDVFYVLDHEKNRLTDPFFIDEIRQSLEFAAK